MKLSNILSETFQCIKIGGVLQNLTNDEMRLYKKVKKEGQLLKKDLSEFDQNIATKMVSKGFLRRQKSIKDNDTKGQIYYTTRGRSKCFGKEKLTEIAPPDRDIEKWIKKNKTRFQQKYGKDYGKYLYGKAWKKYNGTPNLTEAKEGNIMGMSPYIKDVFIRALELIRTRPQGVKQACIEYLYDYQFPIEEELNDADYDSIIRTFMDTLKQNAFNSGEFETSGSRDDSETYERISEESNDYLAYTYMSPVLVKNLIQEVQSILEFQRQLSLDRNDNSTEETEQIDGYIQRLAPYVQRPQDVSVSQEKMTGLFDILNVLMIDFNDIQEKVSQFINEAQENASLSGDFDVYEEGDAEEAWDIINDLRLEKLIKYTPETTMDTFLKELDTFLSQIEKKIVYEPDADGSEYDESYNPLYESQGPNPTIDLDTTQLSIVKKYIDILADMETNPTTRAILFFGEEEGSLSTQIEDDNTFGRIEEQYKQDLYNNAYNSGDYAERTADIDDDETFNKIQNTPIEDLFKDYSTSTGNKNFLNKLNGVLQDIRDTVSEPTYGNKETDTKTQSNEQIDIVDNYIKTVQTKIENNDFHNIIDLIDDLKGMYPNDTELIIAIDEYYDKLQSLALESGDFDIQGEGVDEELTWEHVYDEDILTLISKYSDEVETEYFIKKMVNYLKQIVQKSEGLDYHGEPDDDGSEYDESYNPSTTLLENKQSFTNEAIKTAFLNAFTDVDSRAGLAEGLSTWLESDEHKFLMDTRKEYSKYCKDYLKDVYEGFEHISDYQQYDEVVDEDETYMRISREPMGEILNNYSSPYRRKQLLDKLIDKIDTFNTFVEYHPEVSTLEDNDKIQPLLSSLKYWKEHDCNNVEECKEFWDKIKEIDNTLFDLWSNNSDNQSVSRVLKGLSDDVTEIINDWNSIVREAAFNSGNFNEYAHYYNESKTKEAIHRTPLKELLTQFLRSRNVYFYEGIKNLLKDILDVQEPDDDGSEYDETFTNHQGEMITENVEDQMTQMVLDSLQDESVDVVQRAANFIEEYHDYSLERFDGAYDIIYKLFYVEVGHSAIESEDYSIYNNNELDTEATWEIIDRIKPSELVDEYAPRSDAQTFVDNVIGLYKSHQRTPDEMLEPDDDGSEYDETKEYDGNLLTEGYETARVRLEAMSAIDDIIYKIAPTGNLDVLSRLALNTMVSLWFRDKNYIHEDLIDQNPDYYDLYSDLNYDVSNKMYYSGDFDDEGSSDEIWDAIEQYNFVDALKVYASDDDIKNFFKQVMELYPKNTSFSVEPDDDGSEYDESYNCKGNLLTENEETARIQRENLKILEKGRFKVGGHYRFFHSDKWAFTITEIQGDNKGNLWVSIDYTNRDSDTIMKLTSLDEMFEDGRVESYDAVEPDTTGDEFDECYKYDKYKPLIEEIIKQGK